MCRIVPNSDPVGNDFCLHPVELDVSVIIVDNGTDCFWYHEALDRSSAERLVFSKINGSKVEAFCVDLKLILPAADDVRALTAELDQLRSDSVRVNLRVD